MSPWAQHLAPLMVLSAVVLAIGFVLMRTRTRPRLGLVLFGVGYTGVILTIGAMPLVF